MATQRSGHPAVARLGSPGPGPVGGRWRLPRRPGGAGTATSRRSGARSSGMTASRSVGSGCRRPTATSSTSTGSTAIRRRETARPTLLVLHGLEGSSRSHYASGLLRAGRAAGWHPVVFNFRSCSGELNRLPRFYHSGETGDLAWVVQALVARAPGVPIGAVGVSLGGNVLLKWLGRGGRGGTGGAPWRGRDLGPLRRGRLRTRPRPRIPPSRLRRQLPEDDALEGHREGAPVSRLRGRGGDAPGANVRPVRPGRHGAAERLPGRGRLLDAGLQRPLPRADPPADPPPQRPRRPDRARAHPAGSAASSRRTSAPSSPHAAVTPGSSRADGPGARGRGRSGGPWSS